MVWDLENNVKVIEVINLLNTDIKINPNGITIIKPINPKISSNCLGMWTTCKLDEFFAK